MVGWKVELKEACLEDWKVALMGDVRVLLKVVSWDATWVV